VTAEVRGEHGPYLGQLLRHPHVGGLASVGTEPVEQQDRGTVLVPGDGRLVRRARQGTGKVVRDELDAIPGREAHGLVRDGEPGHEPPDVQQPPQRRPTWEAVDSGRARGHGASVPGGHPRGVGYR
jgi:hypothetical protein